MSVWSWLKRSFAEGFEPALSGAWDGGAGTAERRRIKRRATSEHVVTWINGNYYVCDVCGSAGSERWAIRHQFPAEGGRLDG